MQCKHYELSSEYDNRGYVIQKCIETGEIKKVPGTMPAIYQHLKEKTIMGDKKSKYRLNVIEQRYGKYLY